MNALQLCFACCSSRTLFSHSDQFASEDPCVIHSLFRLRVVALATLRRLKYKVLGFRLGCFELLCVAVDLADIGADQSVAFAFLRRNQKR